MATLENRIILLAQAIGTDIKTLRNAIGVLANLTTTTKTDVVSAINEVLGKVNTNTNAIGTLTSLSTTAKSNLVAAINEVAASLGTIDLTSLINDAAAAGVVDKTYSVDKILTLINNVKQEVLGSAPAALDTLNELAAALGNNPNLATDIATALGKRVRVDAAQTFTAPEQTQARENIGAASTTEVGTAQSTANDAYALADGLATAVGNTDHDFVGDYTTAKS